MSDAGSRCLWTDLGLLSKEIVDVLSCCLVVEVLDEEDAVHITRDLDRGHGDGSGGVVESTNEVSLRMTGLQRERRRVNDRCTLCCRLLPAASDENVDAW